MGKPGVERNCRERQVKMTLVRLPRKLGEVDEAVCRPMEIRVVDQERRTQRRSDPAAPLAEPAQKRNEREQREEASVLQSVPERFAVAELGGRKRNDLPSQLRFAVSDPYGDSASRCENAIGARYG